MHALVKVAMLSYWHVHAPDYTRGVQNNPDAEITVVWDEEPDRGKEWAEKLGVPFEADLNKVLARDDVDAVVVDAPTNMHEEVMVAALQAGKHVFTEKVVAPTVAEVDRIGRAAMEANVHFVVSLPQRGRASYKYAKEALDKGLIGHLTLVRVRVAHSGASDRWLPDHFYDPEACGGGAMIDLGAHPMYLARWFGGKPKAVTARLARFMDHHQVDDNSVAIIDFESGALGVAETSFVSASSPQSLELYGTEGSIIISGPGQEVWVSSRKSGSEIEGWIKPTQLPPADPTPLDQWINAIKTGTPAKISLQDGRDLTELMEAATRSSTEGRRIDLPL